MSIKIEMGKEYQTRSGAEVKIYAVDVPDSSGYTVHGVIHEDDGDWNMQCWRADGHCWDDGTDDLDLVEKPKETFIYVNVFKNINGMLYTNNSVFYNEEAANKYSIGRVGRLKLKLEERFDT